MMLCFDVGEIAVGKKCGSHLQGEKMMMINCNNDVRLLSHKQNTKSLHRSMTETALRCLKIFWFLLCSSVCHFNEPLNQRRSFSTNWVRYACSGFLEILVQALTLTATICSLIITNQLFACAILDFRWRSFLFLDPRDEQILKASFHRPNLVIKAMSNLRRFFPSLHRFLKAIHSCFRSKRRQDIN